MRAQNLGHHPTPSSWTRGRSYLQSADTGQNSCWWTAGNYTNRGVQHPLPNLCPFLKWYHYFVKSHILFFDLKSRKGETSCCQKNTEIHLRFTEYKLHQHVSALTVLQEYGYIGRIYAGDPSSALYGLASKWKMSDSLNKTSHKRTSPSLETLNTRRNWHTQ